MNLHSTVIVLLALSSSAATGAAQEDSAPGEAPGLTGSWLYVAPTGDPIGDAIERGIAELGFVTKPIARRRLRSTTEAYRTVNLHVSETEIATVYDGRAAIRSPADGSAVRWRREDGEVLELTAHVRDGVLVQTFRAEDGSRENAFSVSGDGRRLTLQVTIRSDRLPEPIVYRLAYRRGG